MTNLPEVFLESSLFYTIALFQKRCHHFIYCKLKNELLLKMKKVSCFCIRQVSPAFQSLYTECLFSSLC